MHRSLCQHSSTSFFVGLRCVFALLGRDSSVYVARIICLRYTHEKCFFSKKFCLLAGYWVKHYPWLSKTCHCLELCKMYLLCLKGQRLPRLHSLAVLHQLSHFGCFTKCFQRPMTALHSSLHSWEGHVCWLQHFAWRLCAFPACKHSLRLKLCILQSKHLHVVRRAGLRVTWQQHCQGSETWALHHPQQRFQYHNPS